MFLPKWERFILGALGASLTIAPPLYNKIVSIFFVGASLVNDGTLIALCLAWVIGTWVAARTNSEHVLEPLLIGMGLPGLIASATVGLQTIT